MPMLDYVKQLEKALEFSGTRPSGRKMRRIGREIERSAGMPLPSDFVRWITTHGGGSLMSGYFVVLSPERPDYSRSIELRLAALRADRTSAEAFPSLYSFPYDVFPEPGGLYPWGADENAAIVTWRTGGEPDDWPVVCRTHEGHCEQFDMTMTEFLFRVLSREIMPRIWDMASRDGITDEDLTYDSIFPPFDSDDM